VNQQVISDETTNTMKTLAVNNFDQFIHHFLHLKGGPFINGCLVTVCEKLLWLYVHKKKSIYDGIDKYIGHFP